MNYREWGLEMWRDIQAARFVVGYLEGSTAIWTPVLELPPQPKCRMFLADADDGRSGVVKIMVRTEAAQRDRFESELARLARIDHPNVLRVIDRGEYVSARDFYPQPDRRSFVVYEPALPGAALGNGSPSPPDSAVRFAIDLLRGLAAAHALGFVHGELRPQTLWQATTGVKLGDFGYARIEAGSPAPDSFLPLGSRPDFHDLFTIAESDPSDSWPYLAPCDFVTPTPAADVYTTSLLLLELLTGIAPQRDLDLDVRTWPDPPAWFADLFARGTAEDPEARPSATAMADELERLRLELSAG